MSETWTVLKILRWITEYLKEKGVPNPRLDAELLLCSALAKDRVGLYLCYDQPLQSAELKQIRALVSRRALREPLQYILGQTEFWSLSFEVMPEVLIPRGDTEILVEEALRLLGGTGEMSAGSGRVLDVGTGSGAVAIALAHSCPQLVVEAVDISATALQLAARNARRHAVSERLQLRHQDMAALDGGPYRLVVSNPPYVTTAQLLELMPEVRDYEPHLALAAGSDGLDCYRLLCAQAAQLLEPGGWLVVEIGAGQAPAVRALMAAGGLQQIFQRDDYSAVTRVVGGCRSAVASADGDHTE